MAAALVATGLHFFVFLLDRTHEGQKSATHVDCHKKMVR